jgi:hypothetical protein
MPTLNKLRRDELIDSLTRRQTGIHRWESEYLHNLFQAALAKFNNYYNVDCEEVTARGGNRLESLHFANKGSIAGLLHTVMQNTIGENEDELNRLFISHADFQALERMARHGFLAPLVIYVQGSLQEIPDENPDLYVATYDQYKLMGEDGSIQRYGATGKKDFGKYLSLRHFRKL